MANYPFGIVAKVLVLALLSLGVSARHIPHDYDGADKRQLVVPNCKETRVAYEGATCQSIANQGRITVEEFTIYNGFSGDCNALVPGTVYCVKIFPDPDNPQPQPSQSPPPSPTPIPTVSPSVAPNPIPPPGPAQPGAAPNCARWTLTKENDTCLTIIAALGHTFNLDDFRTWNPAVGTGCTTMWANFYVCTAIASEPVPSPAPGDDGAPSPRQPGQPAGCNRWHLAARYDNCYTIMRGNPGVRIEDVLAWNPAFGVECGNVWEGYYACVGVGK